MKISGQVAVITGGASGLGRATAKFLAENGARVGVVDLKEEAATEVARDVGGFGLGCDVADADASEAALGKIVEKIGTPSILVCCAGIADAGRILGRDGPGALKDYERVIRVNLIGTYNWMRLAAWRMKDNKPNEDGERGAIVTTASVAAFEGQIGQAAYASSKGAVASLTLPAARELARFGIRVVAIAPGLFGTPMLMGMTQEIQDSLAAMVPFPSRFGRPDEYAAMVGTIVTNPMLNGTTIRLDGAIRMQPK